MFRRLSCPERKSTPPSQEAESRCVRDARFRTREGPECPTSLPKKYQSFSRQLALELKPTLVPYCWQNACRPGFAEGTICSPSYGLMGG